MDRSVRKSDIERVMRRSHRAGEVPISWRARRQHFHASSGASRLFPSAHARAQVRIPSPLSQDLSRHETHPPLARSRASASSLLGEMLERPSLRPQG
ncbi:MAG: hypothetical protein AB1486_26740 [Planctomycetota bacterium]